MLHYMVDIYFAVIIGGVDGELRLQGGNGDCQGRLEVFDNATNEWYQVCNDGFTAGNALTACSEIQGCSEANAQVTGIAE